tara:strand:- start:323 stop:1123 length:801 start_codon:yes stop_codon:yes gene_type:complete
MGRQALVDQGNEEALAKAGAVTKARNDTKLLGMSLRQDAARFGRNQTGTGLAASAAALQGGQAAGNVMSGQTAQGNAAGTTQGLMGTAVSGNSSAGNMALNQWRTQVQAQSQADAGLGSLLGTVGGIAGNLGSASIIAASSEELKESKKPINDEEALDGLKKVPVEKWKYKKGVADEGEHMGPYSEDMNKVFGDQVAPGGKGLDLVSVSGQHHAAIRALGKEVDGIKKEIGLSKEKVPREKRAKSRVKSELMDADLGGDLVGLTKL